jgi:hypothetical protein
MANRYGEAAIMATRQVPSASMSPVERWEHSMMRLYPTSSVAREKSCPRGDFLGLCEEGLVKGFQPAPTPNRETTNRTRSAQSRYWPTVHAGGPAANSGER